MKVYRVGNWLHRMKCPFLPFIFNGIIRLVHNSAVFSETKIGSGTIFSYGGIGVVIHKGCEIGENCVIGSNVTIGGKSNSQGVPVIGNNCFIATGVKILGDIEVGDNSVIGANAVVVTSIPKNSLVTGIPAKVIKTNINPRDYY